MQDTLDKHKHVTLNQCCQVFSPDHLDHQTQFLFYIYIF